MYVSFYFSNTHCHLFIFHIVLMITDKTYIANMIWFAIFACMTEGRNHFVSIFSYSIIAELLSKATNYDVLSLRIFMYVHMYI